MFVTTYQSQGNGKMERFDRARFSTLPFCVGDHPNHWDLYTDAGTYAYNIKVHRVMSFSSFEWVLSLIPPPVAIEAQPNLSAYPSF